MLLRRYHKEEKKEVETKEVEKPQKEEVVKDVNRRKPNKSKK